MTVKGDRKMRKNNWLLATGMILVLGLSACQKSPDSSIVVNKDMDNLIDEAQNGEGAVNVADVAGSYDTYQTSLQNDSLGVSVHVDARVDIPEVEQMSVFRVRQAPITQELLTKVQQELVTEALYDGAILSVETRSDIEQELRQERASYDSLAQEFEGETLRILQEERQTLIDDLQEAYESAPTEVQWQEYPSDGQLHSAEERYQENPSDHFYSWHYELNPNGEVYYGVTDGANGDNISLYVQNNPERGNCIRYRKDRHGYEWVAGIDMANLESVSGGGFSSNIWKGEEEHVPQTIYDHYGGEVTFTELPDEPVTLTEAEAIGMADNLLAKLGIADFQYYEGGLYNEVLDIRYQYDLDETEGVPYRKEYIFSYMRKIDGAFVTFDANGKHEEGWNGGDYVKKDWNIECIEIRINDSGIIGFDYYAPLTIVETVVDQSNMKTFEEVRSTFETMVTVANAEDPDIREENTTIEIDRVILGYARISEADSYDTGLMVPVWDFKGKKTDSYGYLSDYGSVMTINAIDGSVIDRNLGY